MAFQCLLTRQAYGKIFWTLEASEWFYFYQRRNMTQQHKWKNKIMIKKRLASQQTCSNLHFPPLCYCIWGFIFCVWKSYGVCAMFVYDFILSLWVCCFISVLFFFSPMRLPYFFLPYWFCSVNAFFLFLSSYNSSVPCRLWIISAYDCSKV